VQGPRPGFGSEWVVQSIEKAANGLSKALKNAEFGKQDIAFKNGVFYQSYLHKAGRKLPK